MHFFQDLEAHPLLLSLRLRPPYFAVGPLHLLPNSFSDMCVCVCVCARVRARAIGRPAMSLSCRQPDMMDTNKYLTNLSRRMRKHVSNDREQGE